VCDKVRHSWMGNLNGRHMFRYVFFTQHTDRSPFLNHFLRKSTQFLLQRKLAFLCVSSAFSAHEDNSSLTVQVCWCAVVWNTKSWKQAFTSARGRNWFHQSLSFDELFGQTIFWECNAEIMDTIVWSWTSNVYCQFRRIDFKFRIPFPRQSMLSWRCIKWVALTNLLYVRTRIFVYYWIQHQYYNSQLQNTRHYTSQNILIQGVKSDGLLFIPQTQLPVRYNRQV
jgi:hypothetical protein